ncbi:Na+/H+ antiporter subunit E [Xanthobacter sp. V0B-10]|uniref:Na+/H+ antiporter subunit E n=1 Tax=Xanthobacter albus TaxID=3119929 RepID=UPI0037287020
MSMAPADEAWNAPCPPTRVQRALRSLWFFLAWIALGRVGVFDLLAGAAASVLAGQLSLRLIPPAAHRPDLLAIGRFLLHFLRRSVAAGLDMAWRVLHPALPLAPGVVAVECGLPRGLARQAFAAVTSLQPGALPAGEEEDALLLHVLDLDGPVLEELEGDLCVFLDALGRAEAPASEDVEERHG